MRILMLGNSFTYFHDLPEKLAQLTGAEVVQHTRGGARLAEQLNPETEMGAKTLTALREEKWDYVVLQEQSNAPITSRDSFFDSVERLSTLIRAAGATPVLYATWAYQRDGARLAEFGMEYEEMYRQMTDAYHEAARRSDCLVADVGMRFHELADTLPLYEAADAYHPSETGTRVAAEVIAEAVLYAEKRSAAR